jgi:hypothetical protein
LATIIVNQVPGQIIQPPPTVIVEGEKVCKVKYIEKYRMFMRQLQNGIMCMGYDKRSWKSATHVDYLQSIDLFHSEQPGNPGSETS